VGHRGGGFYERASELFLHERLLASAHRTTVAAEADYFFVPLYQVRFLPLVPVSATGYRGIRGAEGSDTGSLCKHTLIVNSEILLLIIR
jgi:hypothetical protein